MTHHEQGHGIVNTIGAMNGFRVPKHMKGPLDTHWKIKDKDGWILDYNGERSAVVHQWDRCRHLLNPDSGDPMQQPFGLLSATTQLVGRNCSGGKAALPQAEARCHA